jgi:hypothetical protein
MESFIFSITQKDADKLDVSHHFCRSIDPRCLCSLLAGSISEDTRRTLLGVAPTQKRTILYEGFGSNQWL